ncbi:putative permease [Lachnospiraceae bacterium JC7]|nr:putative permease [Lachnospiraceae bacterium JC7]
MKKEKWEIQIRWGTTAFLVLVCTALIIMALQNFGTVREGVNKLLDILTPIIYGIVMAYLLNPIYDFIYRNTKKLLDRTKLKKMSVSLSKTAGTVMAVLCLLLLIFGLVAMIIPELHRSLISLSNSLPSNLNKIYANAMKLVNDYPEIAGYLSQSFNEFYKFLANFSLEQLMPNFRNFASLLASLAPLGSGIWSMINWIKNFIIGVIIMIYLLNTKETLAYGARKIIFAVFPKKFAVTMLETFHEIDTMFGGFILGKIIDSLIVGVICFIVLSIMDMPYTMLVSVIVGITNIIPFFGPFIGAIPSIILILISSPIQALYFAIFILILQQVDGNIIGPSILHGSTGISSFWVLFAILLFGGLFGFIGMIVGVPIWGIILKMSERLTDHLLRKKHMTLDENGKPVNEEPACGEPV